MESGEEDIDRRNMSIAKKAQDIISWRRLRKGWCMSSTRRQLEYYHSWKARDEARKEKKKLENSKSGRPTRCRERLQRKHLRPSIFSAHLDDDDGGGIRNVWGKEQGLLHRRSWRRGLRDLGEWVGKQIKRNTLRWTGMIQACRMCGGTLVSSKRYS